MNLLLALNSLLLRCSDLVRFRRVNRRLVDVIVWTVLDPEPTWGSSLRPGLGNRRGLNPDRKGRDVGLFDGGILSRRGKVRLRLVHTNLQGLRE
jgi:hypothetical protein